MNSNKDDVLFPNLFFTGPMELLLTTIRARYRNEDSAYATPVVH
jgi:hypothetical protein